MSGWRHDSEEGTETETTNMKTASDNNCKCCIHCSFCRSPQEGSESEGSGKKKPEEGGSPEAEHARVQQHTTEEHSLPGRAGNVCLNQLVNKN